MEEATSYNAFDIRVFQLTDELKYFLGFADRNSVISAAAVIMHITPAQHNKKSTALKI